MQRVIIVSGLKGNPFGKRGDHLLEPGIILALFQHPFPVTFELLFLVELIPKIVNILCSRKTASRANVLHRLYGLIVGYFKRKGETSVEADLFKEQVEGFGSRKPQIPEYFLCFFLQRRPDSNPHSRSLAVSVCY